MGWERWGSVGSGELIAVGTSGAYMGSSSASSEYVYFLGFDNSTWFNPSYGIGRYIGFPIRCIVYYPTPQP